jgi:DNA-binding NarL/FixJ family response regulator
MPIKVLLADDSEMMRRAIVQLLKEEPNIKVVGEAVGFSEMFEKTADLKPDVLLMDLHMHDEREYTPAFVASQLLLSARHIFAISLWNDDASKALARSFGARELLDKNKLALELIPKIMQSSVSEGPRSSPKACGGPRLL